MLELTSSIRGVMDRGVTNLELVISILKTEVQYHSSGCWTEVITIVRVILGVSNNDSEMDRTYVRTCVGEWRSSSSRGSMFTNLEV